MKAINCYYCGGDGREIHVYGGGCEACKGSGQILVTTCKMCSHEPAYPTAEYCGEECYKLDSKRK